MNKSLTGDYITGYLTLISGLSISSVAIYYSVIGLVSIFSSAAMPIMIMGIVLEISKLIATVWLKRHWSDGPVMFKSFFIIAVLIFMFITSMGIFGFLSRAHSDQAVPFGDTIEKIEIIDEKIKTQQENITIARKAISQMNEAVDQTMARSTSEGGAAKAIQIRKVQAKERIQLQNDITTAQNEISNLHTLKEPLAAAMRRAEAEVGPIKYIAAMIYGDTLDASLLEHAVRWVIILIVVVFDPMAVMLLLACQHTFNQIHIKQQVEIPTVELPSIKAKPIVKEPIVHESIVQEPITENDSISNVFIDEIVNTGDAFPISAEIGQEFTRIDYNPPRSFIFNGDQWVDAENYKV
jgi:hypothetical protein